MYKCVFKRLFDLLASITGLILVSPLLLVLLTILSLSPGRSPFFLQTRPGKNSRLFRLIKFRTMNNLCDASKNLLSDEQRLTSTGKFLRKYSLDEIPQLVNVLMGDMSLVGPRPLLVDYLPLYNENQARRHEVRPGLTGWAQINGRNSISWERKFDMDIWYVDNLSFGLDLKILFMTILKVLKHEGIAQPGWVTAMKFTGNQ